LKNSQERETLKRERLKRLYRESVQRETRESLSLSLSLWRESHSTATAYLLVSGERERLKRLYRESVQREIHERALKSLSLSLSGERLYRERERLK